MRVYLLPCCFLQPLFVYYSVFELYLYTYPLCHHKFKLRGIPQTQIVPKLHLRTAVDAMAVRTIGWTRRRCWLRESRCSLIFTNPENFYKPKCSPVRCKPMRRDESLLGPWSNVLRIPPPVIQSSWIVHCGRACNFTQTRTISWFVTLLYNLRTRSASHVARRFMGKQANLCSNHSRALFAFSASQSITGPANLFRRSTQQSRMTANNPTITTELLQIRVSGFQNQLTPIAGPAPEEQTEAQQATRRKLTSS